VFRVTGAHNASHLLLGDAFQEADVSDGKRCSSRRNERVFGTDDYLDDVSADLYPATNLPSSLPALPCDTALALVCKVTFDQSEQQQHVKCTADRIPGAQMVKHPKDDRD
jgi:hypothetical protein